MSKRLLGSVLFASVFTLLLLAIAVVFASSNTQAQAVLSSPSKAQTNLMPNAVWIDIAPFPTVTISPTPGNTTLKLKRANAAAYPTNGKLYVLGGRHGVDGEDVTLQWIWEYTPGSPGSWLRKNALLDG